MTCTNCKKPDAARATLIDGRVVCTWCEEWRHECEARAVLDMPTLKQRRAFLYGTPDSFDRMRGGVAQLRGKDALKRLEATMLEIWNRRQQVANDNTAEGSRQMGLL